MTFLLGANTLTDMAQETTAALNRVSEEPQSYQLSEKYGGLEHLNVSIDDGFAADFE